MINNGIHTFLNPLLSLILFLLHQEFLVSIETIDILHYSLDEIRTYSNQQKQLLWDEIFRLEYPHLYYVDLTQKLLDYKLKMLAKGKKGH